MANISHKNLTGAQLHELKGVDTATTGQVATASGAGATVWTKLTAANLQTTGNPFGAQLFHVREEQANGVSSGTTVSNGTWTTVALNTVKTNEITSASLASNTITLPAGTYHFEGQGVTSTVAPSVLGNTAGYKLRLRNTTAGSTLFVGKSHGFTGNTYMPAGPGYISGRFTLSGTTNLQLQNWITELNGSNGGKNTSGETEVYGEMFFWKIA